MFTVANNNKNNFFSGIEIHSNVSKISTSHIIEQWLTVVPIALSTKYINVIRYILNSPEGQKDQF